MAELYTRRYGRRVERTHAVDAHHFGCRAGWRHALCPPRDRARDRVPPGPTTGFARRCHGRPLPLAALSGDAAAYRHRYLQHGHEFRPRTPLSIPAGNEAHSGPSRICGRLAHRETEKSKTRAPNDWHRDLRCDHHRYLRRSSPASLTLNGRTGMPAGPWSIMKSASQNPPAVTLPGYDVLHSTAAWLDLSSRGKIMVTGEDRARLLHAMSTNQIQALQAGEGCYAFFLNAQGRILADANVFCREDGFLLDVEPETREPLLQHLDKYIIA